MPNERPPCQRTQRSSFQTNDSQLALGNSAVGSDLRAWYRSWTDDGELGERRINRHVVGDERALQERSSESILALSLAGGTARYRLKRRHGTGPDARHHREPDTPAARHTHSQHLAASEAGKHTGQHGRKKRGQHHPATGQLLSGWREHRRPL